MLIETKHHSSLPGLLLDTHTQYFLADGTRTLTGTVNSGGELVTFGGGITVTGALTSSGITILAPTPILVFQDSDSLGAASVGYIEWKDSGGGRAGFFGNSSASNSDLVWKNEQAGNIVIETTGADTIELVGDTNVSGRFANGKISLAATSGLWSILDNSTLAWVVKEGNNTYIEITTLNGFESIIFGNVTTNPTYTVFGNGLFTHNGNVTIDILGATDAILTMDGSSSSPGTLRYESDNELFFFDKNSVIQEANDGAATSITISNTAASGSTDEVSSLIFKSGASDTAGRIENYRIGDYSIGEDYGGMKFYVGGLLGNDPLAIDISSTSSGVTAVNMLGDTFWTGDGTGLPFGEAHQADGSTFDVTMATVDVWVEINAATTNISATELNLVTFPDDHYLQLSKAGKYLVTYSFTAEISSVAGGDQHVESGIMLNDSIQANKGEGHEQYAATNKERNLQGHSIIDVPTNGQISLAIRNTTTGGKDLTIDHLNITVTQLGGT